MRNSQEVFFQKVIERAKKSAVSKKFHQDADDFAQTVALNFLKNPKSKQTIDQAVIDAIRLEYGKGFKDPSKISKKFTKLLSFDSLLVKPSHLPHEARIGDMPADVCTLLDLRQINRLYRGIFLMHYAFGFTYKEIGIVFGLTEQHTWHIISLVSKNLQKVTSKKEWQR